MHSSGRCPGRAESRRGGRGRPCSLAVVVPLAGSRSRPAHCRARHGRRHPTGALTLHPPRHPLKAHPLPSLPQALLQLQQRGQDASRSLSAVRAQLNARERDSKVTTLTLREIELLPREPGGATCYRGVGRMSVSLSPPLSLVSAPRSLTCALPLTAGSSKNRATTSRTRCAHRPRTPRTTSPSSTRRQRCVLGELSASPVCTSMS